MLCAKCNSKVARGAYYCKKCGEVIDDAIAPGLKVEDTRFSSKLVYLLQRHLIRNTVIGILFIFFVGTGIKIGFNYLQSVKDNGSSKIYKLTVINAQHPMTCLGSVCHILIDIKNKSNEIQKLEAVPNLVTNLGQKFGPADPARMGDGANYCEPKISLTLQPHQFVQYLGICAQDIPVGTALVGVELRDSSSALVVSGLFRAVAS